MWEGETQFTLHKRVQDIYKAHQASHQESSSEEMLFPDGPLQPVLFIAKQLPRRLRNVATTRMNSASWCGLPAARLAQGESDVGQMEGTVFSSHSSVHLSRYQQLAQPSSHSEDKKTYEGHTLQLQLTDITD